MRYAIYTGSLQTDLWSFEFMDENANISISNCDATRRIRSGGNELRDITYDFVEFLYRNSVLGIDFL